MQLLFTTDLETGGWVVGVYFYRLRCPDICRIIRIPVQRFAVTRAIAMNES